MAQIFFDTSANLASNATFTGSPHDAGSWTDANRYGVAVYSDQAGTIYIDGSYDGVTWRQCFSNAVVGNTPYDADVPVRFRYYRARYVNGAAATTGTNFAIHSSFRSGQ